MRASPAVAVLTTLLLAGCFGTSGSNVADESSVETDWPRCEHPWPCADGSEWPVDLEGPFANLPPEQVLIESHDGVTLAGHVWRPDVPDGTQVPVIVFSSPYYSTRRDPAEINQQNPTNGLLGDPSTSWSGWPGTLFGNFHEHGYALLMIAVRGTGESGGCLGWGGIDEQLDHGEIIDWAASQEWSNGRVGFWGISYMGTTPFEATLQGRDALKAIWAGGIITDWYHQGYDIQGLSLPAYTEFTLSRFVGLSSPPANTPIDRADEWPARWVERACPETPDNWLRQAGSTYVDERNPDWFEERRYVDRFDEITAAVHVPHGMRDNDGHRFQEDVIWDLMPNAPKWFLLGQWGHTINFDQQLATYPHGHDDWNLTFDWFDFWLKGIGDPPRIGTVDYQDTSGTWHEANQWPPAATLEALHLGASGLGTDATGSQTFHSRSATTRTEPIDDVLPGWQEFACGPADDPETIAVYISEPITGTIAGNPYAVLELESTMPGGGFRVDLLTSPSEDVCADAEETEFLSRGGVDLRFQDGGYIGTDFPTDTVTTVRVDLYSLAAHLNGEHLVVVLRPPHDPGTQPWNPIITIHGESQVVLPFIDGTAGGVAPNDVQARPS